MHLRAKQKIGRLVVMTDTEANPGKVKSMRKKIDRLLLGVVVGGAVGSILGITLAPKSGKETRELVGNRSRETWNKISAVIEKQEFHRQKKPKKGIWYFLNRLFVRNKDDR